MAITILEHYPSIAEVDFKGWHEESGVSCLITDMEGTLTEYGGAIVFPEAIKALDVAREAGYLTIIGIFTNKKDEEVVAQVAEQIDADGWFTPKTRRERKPNSTMIQRAIDKFKIERQAIGVVGDKKSADVEAGRRAGIARIGWVDRYGSADHIGDRLIRRPLEAPYKRYLKSIGMRRYRHYS